MTKAFFILCLASLNSTFISAQIDSSIVVFQYANVIDGISMNTMEDVTVTIEKGMIKSIEKHRAEPASSAILFDLTDKWFLPGYIDTHVHFFNTGAAQRALTTGVTTARTMQCDHFLDIEIKDAHQKGRADLPHIVATGYQIRPDMSEAFYAEFPELSDLKPTVRGVENVGLGNNNY